MMGAPIIIGLMHNRLTSLDGKNTIKAIYRNLTNARKGGALSPLQTPFTALLTKILSDSIAL